MVEGKRCSSSVPPPPPLEQRCVRNDGKKWQCKALRFQGHRYCEKHHLKELSKRKKPIILKEQLHRDKADKCPPPKEQKKRGVVCVLDSSEEEEEEEVNLIRKKRKGDSHEEDKGFQKRQARRPSCYAFSSSSEEEEEEEQVEVVQPTSMKKSNYNEVFEIKRSEECSISELILSLKASFSENDYEKVVSILMAREENGKRDKEEAEMKAVRFKEELGVCEVNCNKLLNEVEERRMKEVIAVEDKLSELELKRVAMEDELHRYKRMCIELKAKNVDLESEKKRAENEIGLWKKRFQDLESKGSSAEVYVEPRGLSTDVSCTEEGKRNAARQMGIEGETYCALHRGFLSHTKIKEEALDFNAKVNASASVDSSCHSSAKHSGIGQHAELLFSESGVKDGSVAREKKACQPEVSSYKTLTSPKMGHGSITREQMAFQPDWDSYKMACSPKVGILGPASEGITKLNSSQETKAKPIHFKEGSDQKQNGGEKGSSSEQISASMTKRKWIQKEGTIGSACEDSRVQINKFKARTLQGLASGFDNHSGSSDSCVIRTVLTQPENAKESLTSPRQKLILQESAEKGNGAVGTPSDHLLLHGNACKIPGTTTAETYNEKEVKDFGSGSGAGFNGSSANAKPQNAEDGISKLLQEIRRLKANKPNWKGSPLVVE